MIMNLTILGVFYDEYEDLWQDFINLVHLNWPDLPFELVIADKTFCSDSGLYSKVNFITCGKDAEFSKKIQMSLKRIKTDYVLLLLEDFFISKKIDNNAITEILDFIEENNIVYYTMPIPSFVASKEKQLFKREGKKIYKLSGKNEYVLNCQPAIWDKRFLSLCIGNLNYNAWVFEGLYSKKAFIRKQKILEKCVVDYSNPLNIVHGVVQGKVINKTKEYLAVNGYDLKTKRNCLTKKEESIISLKNSITKVLYFLRLIWLKRLVNKRGVLSKYSNEIEFVSNDVFKQSAFDVFYDKVK